MSDDHEVRELRRRLKLVNKVMGRQGATIASLRGELARTREEHSKLERGELRRLQRFEEKTKELRETDAELLERAREEIERLRQTGPPLLSRREVLAQGHSDRE